MIKRVVTTQDFKILYNSFDSEAISKSNAALHYGGEDYDADLLFKAWNNHYLLANECVIVANFDAPNHADAFIWFVISEDYRVGKTIAQSYVWVSLSPVVGMRVFLEAEKILKRKKSVDYVTMGVLRSSPVSEKFENVLCRRFGYSPEGKSFYKKV